MALTYTRSASRWATQLTNGTATSRHVKKVANDLGKFQLKKSPSNIARALDFDHFNLQNF
jgi:hypothetical protein